MADFDDDIIIKRKNTSKKSTASNSTKKSKKRAYDKQYKVIAILICTSAFLILLALLSYNKMDESIAQFKLADYFGLLRSDEFLVGKVTNVKNWLGLVGAVLSYFLYKNTIGYLIIALPLFVFLWGRVLYWAYEYPKTLIRYSIFYVVSGIIIASIFGTFQHYTWGNQIPDEFSGAIGYFLSHQVVLLIKPLGAAIFFFVLLIGAIILGTDISFDRLFKSIGKSMSEAKSNIDDLVRTDSSTLKKEPIVKEKPTEENNKEFNLKLNIKEAEESAFDEVIKKEPLSNSISNKDIIINNPEDDDFEFELNPDSQNIVTSLESKVFKPAEKVNKFNELSDAEPDEYKNINDEDDDDSSNENDIVISSQPKKKELVVTIENELVTETFNEPLGTAIHDEEINYISPTFDLLDNKRETPKLDKKELETNSRILREKLETFKFYIDNISVTTGPVVAQYEFEIAQNNKVSEINKYSDDLAMALKTEGVRIIAPIPGKGTVGIEIPNKQRSVVKFHDVINSAKFAETKAVLPVALGKTISGDIYITDLTELPHLLIAGATGSGKSIGVNSLICSLLYKLHPSQLKFVIIDPKKVEMPHYSELSQHFMACSPDINSSIINEPEDAISILKSLVLEMEERYKLLSGVKIRNIADYNKKAKLGLLNSKTIKHRPLPYIVVIIDELADLMMTAMKEVEAPITRLAQMARAIGIHLVIATQRPSVNVITGLIKSNFPARLAFTVVSKIDSRTILDQGGAEKLLGKGDMLFSPQGTDSPIRIQNSFISNDEVEKITQFIGNQKGYSSPYFLPSILETQDGNVEDFSQDARDELFETVARMFINQQNASVSFIQRRFSLGYNRAGRIVDQLEAAGVIGKNRGARKREVLMQSESELEAIL